MRMMTAALLALAIPAAATAEEKAASAQAAKAAAELAKKEGSAYVQCDGQPDNMSGGETAARVLGAIALVGLLAPAPEAADPAKRKFGAAGVQVCTTLIEGARMESSADRRIDLVLARALHRIEAKDYAGAITDAALARTTATDAGLAADPFFARSRGRAADLVEAAALYRLGRVAEARDLSLRGAAANQYAVFQLISMPRYQDSLATGSAAEQAYFDAIVHVYPMAGIEAADRLEELGRFAEAAKLRDAVVAYNAAAVPKKRNSTLMAQTAVSHALAGDAVGAATIAKEAQANFDRRKADGEPEADAARFVEVMDLYAIIRDAAAGDSKTARRLFAARSQWVAASFGSTVETSRRLRQGASADELIGGLAKTPEAMWQDRAATQRAELLAKDADNKTLFAMLPPRERASGYESMSKKVWRTDKSALILKPGKTDPDAGAVPFELLYLPGSPFVTPEGYALHAALLAKSRGHKGFVMMPVVASGIVGAKVRTGNPGDDGLPAPFFNDAETVVAALSPIIPSPEALKQRQADRSRSAALAR